MEAENAENERVNGGMKEIQRSPYGDFFSGRSPVAYFACLLKNGDIETFRKPDQPGYGPHLGFDYRKFEEYIDRNFIQNAKMELVEKNYTGFRMNVIYVLKKQ